MRCSRDLGLPFTVHRRGFRLLCKAGGCPHVYVISGGNCDKIARLKKLSLLPPPPPKVLPSPSGLSRLSPVCRAYEPHLPTKACFRHPPTSNRFFHSLSIRPLLDSLGIFTMNSQTGIHNIQNSHLFLPLDDMSASSVSLSTEEDREYRWPDAVSPKAALTFAALWDPDEGMITFSGARLLENESVLGIESRSCVHGDGAFQANSCSQRSMPVVDEVTEPLDTLHHTFRTFLYRVPNRSFRYHQQRSPLTRVASVSGTKDSYKREITLRPVRSLHIPRVNKVETNLPQSVRASPLSSMFKSRMDRTPEMRGMEEEPSVNGRKRLLSSRFSATTMSTSTNVDVSYDVHRTTPPSPVRLSLNDKVSLSSPSCSPPSSPRRRLRKRRQAPEGHPSTAPTAVNIELPKKSPEERKPLSLLSRSSSRRSPSSPTSPSRRGSIKYKFPIFPRRRSSRRSNASDEGWVYVELKTSIEQRFLPDFADD